MWVAYGAIPLAGIVIGILVVLATATASEGTLLIGGLTLPLGFGLALAAWRSLLGVWLAAILGRSALRSRGSEARFRDETVRAFSSIREAGLERLPFTWVFIPVGVLVGMTAALAMGLVGGGGMLPAVLLLAAASVQGVGLHRLARTGRLPLPAE